MDVERNTQATLIGELQIEEPPNESTETKVINSFLAAAGCF